MSGTNLNLSRDRTKESRNALVYSYMTFRNLIGYLGMFLPVILLFTTRTSGSDLSIEPSISDYFYTSNGDVLVAILCLLGAFLFTYKGYYVIENLLSSITAICALGIAFSPTSTKYLRDSFSIHTPQFDVPHVFGVELHLVFAFLFFLTLSLISLIYFPRTDADKKNSLKTQKNKRNVIFRLCGWVMIGCIAFLTVYIFSDSVSSLFGEFPVIFTVETIAIEFFAISWLTKGETFFPDGEHYFRWGYREVIRSIRK